jgi:tRNA threonylcarbamoyladenosine biosynthesis protein TsaE
LGAGKTSWVRAMIQSLGYQGRVVSPTYTLLEQYQLGDFTLLHLDLYRLSDPAELEFLGVQDLFVPGTVICAEWPEKGRGVLPEPDLVLRLSYRGDGRLLTLAASGPRGERWIESITRQAERLELQPYE